MFPNFTVTWNEELLRFVQHCCVNRHYRLYVLHCILNTSQLPFSSCLALKSLPQVNLQPTFTNIIIRLKTLIRSQITVYTMSEFRNLENMKYMDTHQLNYSMIYNRIQREEQINWCKLICDKHNNNTNFNAWCINCYQLWFKGLYNMLPCVRLSPIKYLFYCCSAYSEHFILSQHTICISILLYVQLLPFNNNLTSMSKQLPPQLPLLHTHVLLYLLG